MNRRKLWMGIGLGFLGVMLMAFIAAYLWVADAAMPMPEALMALESNGTVTVSTDPWLTFKPADGAVTTGFIFYPGGKVDPRAYAPPARAIAKGGHQVVIVPMPLNLAVLAPNRANDVIAAYPEVRHWAIGGHSLGGTMAATYAAKHGDAVDALILWASYPTEGGSLALETDLATASIFGTLDGLISLDEIEQSGNLLPTQTEWTAIEGGNHAQFGWYGPQDGDNPATISREAQQAAAVTASLNLLDSLP
jgi:dienelactone hydrolase